jgi:2-amino-4-hydroxy-6-hydroxymethyldihydropteridine diphosphokinase
MTDHHSIFLSLGGNQGNVLHTLKAACALLSNHVDIKKFRCSHFYSTSPVEVTEPSDWFVNAVCSFETTLSPPFLLDLTQSIETSFGKQKKQKNSPRPLDIDILFIDSISYSDPRMIIPHPRWKERLFVLIPLKDLIESIIIDGNIYKLSDLINLFQSEQAQQISLLEKNPDIQ